MPAVQYTVACVCSVKGNSTKKRKTERHLVANVRVKCRAYFTSINI